MAHRDPEEPFQVEAACLAYQGEVGAFACPEGEGAFWEGSSSSTTRMRDKIGATNETLLVTLDAR